MRTTIDKAGRLVVPKELREQVGMTAGVVEVTCDGSGIRIEPVAGAGLQTKRGRLVIPKSGSGVDDAAVLSLRDAGRT